MVAVTPSKQSSDGDGVETKYLRRLGRNESYQLAMYVLDQYRGTSVSCRYEMPAHLRGRGARAELVRFLQDVIAETVMEHPVLQVGIAHAESSRACFVQLGALDLDQHMEWQSVEAWDDFETVLRRTTARQLDAVYPRLDQQPGWKMVILSQDEADFVEILMTWNHPHADGMSGKVFHESLLKNLNLKRGGGTTGVVHLIDGHILPLPSSPAPRLPPPVEEIVGLPMDVRFILTELIKDVLPSSLCRRATQADWAPIRAAPYKTQFRSFTVDNDRLEVILAACRRHDTTLTGLLHGLVLVSLALRLDEEDASAFQSDTTMQNRRFLPKGPAAYPWLQPEKTMGNFVTQIAHDFGPGVVRRIRDIAQPQSQPLSQPHRHPSPQDNADYDDGDHPAMTADLLDEVWKASARVRSDIAAKLALGLRNDTIGIMKFVRDWNTQMKAMAKKPRHASWLVSGLGVIDGRPSGDESGEGGWRIRRAQFGHACEIPSAALVVAPMTVRDEGMCLAVSWQDCAVEAALGDGLTGDLDRWLNSIGRTR